MKIETDNWFAGNLDGAGIENHHLKNHYPAGMPSFQIDLKNWVAAAKLAKDAGMRLVSLWAAEGGREDSVLYAYIVFAHPAHRQIILRTGLDPDVPLLPSVSRHHVSAIRMERTMQDMLGIKVDGLQDARRWIKHEHWPAESYPLRSSFKPDAVMPQADGEYQFLKADGDGVYEIPVGPVHAGIIEPGHFRFLAVGEEILNLEERLGYVHKGIEKRIEGMRATEAIKIASRVSGDTTVGHGWAFAKACENAACLELPERANALRGVLCERERMANHIGDIGAICNDVALAFMHMQMQKLREDIAGIHKNIFGHRLLMNVIIPGGLNRDIDTESIRELGIQTKLIAKEVEELREIYTNNASIQERVIGSGIVNRETAESIGLLGYAGRASGLSSDVRVDSPYPPYDKIKIDVFRTEHGDAATRISVRFEEIKESARIICQLLNNLPEGKTYTSWQAPEDGLCGFSTVEGWRGEIAHWIRFGSNGAIARCVIKDPSTVNWLALELAVRGLPVPDFPLNNKSFNCSYSGNDL
ncbi:MAG: NADH-quinone oxidoreductase subunit C [Nitrospinota bacterium]